MKWCDAFKGATAYEAFCGPLWVRITYFKYWWLMKLHNNKTFWQDAINIGWDISWRSN